MDEMPRGAVASTELAKDGGPRKFLWMAAKNVGNELMPKPYFSEPRTLSKCFRNEANIVAYMRKSAEEVVEGSSKVVTIVHDGKGDDILLASLRTAVLAAEGKVSQVLWVIFTERYVRIGVPIHVNGNHTCKRVGVTGGVQAIWSRGGP